VAILLLLREADMKTNKLAMARATVAAALASLPLRTVEP
jgi:hypothetical protein